MTYINAAADFLADTSTLWRSIRRYFVFLIMCYPTVKVGYEIGYPGTAGFMLGYIWGGLTVYGLARQIERSK